MSEHLTPERLGRIRERADAATPGPWGVGNSEVIGLGIKQTSRGSFSYDAQIARVLDLFDREDSNSGDRYLGSQHADAEFIAHARQDVDDLLAEVERLRACLDRRDDAAAEALADQTLMRGLTVEDGKAVLSLIPPRELALQWVHCARGMLDGAENYSETPIEFEVGLGGEPERYALIVQRVGKVTPHQARRQAEAERDAYRDALQQLLTAAADPDATGIDTALAHADTLLTQQLAGRQT